MSDHLSQEQDYRRDVLRRLQKLLDILEGHIDILHQTPEQRNMKPGECEQALDRHIVLMLRILQMRQQYVHEEHKPDNQSLIDRMLFGEDNS